MSEVKHHPELDGPRPPCFSFAQWTSHVKCEKALAKQGHEPDPSGFCAECTVRYKHKMMEQGKCRHPYVVFVVDDDGELQGLRQITELHIAK